MTARFFLISGLVFMLLAVMLGAFGAHAIQDMLSVKQMATWQTASEYHFYHALALTGLGIWSEKKDMNIFTRASGFFMITGILLFAGSLYLLALSGISMLGMITPIGGLLFIFAWLSWIVSASSSRSD